MSGEAQLLLMIAGVHLLGLACVAVLMIPALRDEPDPPSRPADGGPDDGWGNHPRRPRRPRATSPAAVCRSPTRVPARVRLRDHERLHDRRPRASAARPRARAAAAAGPVRTGRAVAVAPDPRAEAEQLHRAGR